MVLLCSLGQAYLSWRGGTEHSLLLNEWRYVGIKNNKPTDLRQGGTVCLELCVCVWHGPERCFSSCRQPVILLNSTLLVPVSTALSPCLPLSLPPSIYPFSLSFHPLSLSSFFLALSIPCLSLSLSPSLKRLSLPQTTLPLSSHRKGVSVPDQKSTPLVPPVQDQLSVPHTHTHISPPCPRS